MHAGNREATMYAFKRLLAAALLIYNGCCCLQLACAPAAAQAFPSRPMRFLVGFPPGGGADSVARILADEMSRSLGQPIIVENKPGATGALVLTDLARAERDGHVVLVTPSSYAVFSAMAKVAPLNGAGGFTWIGNVIDMPFYTLVHDDSEARSLSDLIAMAKAAPGTMS